MLTRKLADERADDYYRSKSRKSRVAAIAASVMTKSPVIESIVDPAMDINKFGVEGLTASKSIGDYSATSGYGLGRRPS